MEATGKKSHNRYVNGVGRAFEYILFLSSWRSFFVVLRDGALLCFKDEREASSHVRTYRPLFLFFLSFFLI